MAESIQQLRIYNGARELEDAVFDFVRQLPEAQAYPLGNDLRRASADICHYLSEAHRLYSYRLKLDNLALARTCAEKTLQLLERAAQFGATDPLKASCTTVIKQSWGLTKFLQAKRSTEATRREVSAKDELVAARA